MINDIVKTYGFHWVILELFVVVCLVAGFVIFPAIVLIWTWNHIVIALKILHTINILQGILLWGIIAITLYITTKEKFKLSYEKGKKISREEVKQIIKDARSHGIPLKTLKSKLPKRKRKR